MSMADVLFKGVTGRNARGFTRDLIVKLAPSKVITPCSGAFSLECAAAAAGIPTQNIHGCDITLYSCAVGNLLAGNEFPISIKSKDWEWLAPYMADPTGAVASVILAIRILQYQAGKPSVYKEHRIRELQTRSETYIAMARESLDKLRATIGGIQFSNCDFRALIGQYRDDPSAMIICSPPWYSGGYNKMFMGVDDVFEWQKPDVNQFTTEEFGPFMEWMGQAKSPALVYYGTSTRETIEDPAETFGPPWTSVFAEKPRTSVKSTVNWVMFNGRETEKVLVRADMPKSCTGKYRMFTTGLVDADGRLEAKTEDRNVVSYYRDLLVHRLGLIGSELYAVILYNGSLLAAVGLHTQNYRQKGQPVNLTFCFTPRHDQYARIQKLAISCILSSWFWRDVTKGCLEDSPAELQTTMLSPHPEVKTARGLLKMKTRERMPDGTYRLSYYGKIETRTRAETVALWLKKWGDLKHDE